MADHKLRVLLVCTGIGVISRGIETFAAECFSGLNNDARLDLRLAATRIEKNHDVYRVWSASRDTSLAASLGYLIRRNPYVAEQLSSLLPIASIIRQFRPDLVFTSEANLTYQLFRWRRWIGHEFRLLFSNGGPCGPDFPRMDFIHQVAPYYTDLSLERGDLKARHITVPYGISTPPEPQILSSEAKCSIRRGLGLPEHLPLILSVGYIDRHHKRMDYLIREVAAMPHPRPHLVILGHQDRQSESIIHEAHARLGLTGCTIRSVSSSQVWDYYRAADVFVLCSLREGFGRVYLEAAMYGLPVIAHNHPVMEYVLDGIGDLADLSKPNALSPLLIRQLAVASSSAEVRLRWETVRRRFDWTHLRDQYVEMFRYCATTPLPWL